MSDYQATLSDQRFSGESDQKSDLTSSVCPTLVSLEFPQDRGNARSDVSDSKYESTAGAVISVT